MKVTFVLSGLGISGGVRVIAKYAQLLRDRGHTVVIADTATQPRSIRQTLRHWVSGTPGRSVSASHFDGLDLPIIRVPLSRVIKDRDVPDADVIVATLWRTAAPVMKLSPSKGAKAYFIQHYELFNTQIYKREVKRTWTFPMHKITVCQWLTDLARDEYGDAKVSTVPNSVDLDLFHSVPRGKQACPTVGFMYSRSQFKGCDIALRAIEIASKCLPELKVKTFGLSEALPSLPLPSGCTLEVRPSQRRIVEIYSSCDAWLFASRTEGFGLPLLESMACRTPVIGTPAGAAPDLLPDGRGILVPHENPESMAQAILFLAGLPDSEWRKMSESAFNAASAYTWDDATDRFEASLQLALERSRLGEIRGGASI